MSRLGNRGDIREEVDRGAALVEFAFVLPILLLLIFGLIDFSRAYNAKQELTHATREGVRVFAVTNSHSAAADAFWDGATSLDAAKVTPVIPSDNACVAGSAVEVQASYAFDFIVLPFYSINIGSRAVMRCGG